MDIASAVCCHTQISSVCIGWFSIYTFYHSLDNNELNVDILLQTAAGLAQSGQIHGPSDQNQSTKMELHKWEILWNKEPKINGHKNKFGWDTAFHFIYIIHFNDNVNKDPIIFPRITHHNAILPMSHT